MKPVNLRGAAAVALLVSCGAPLYAQNYPVKPVRMIAPFPPGGSSDLIARILAQKMAEGLGQPVVIENRPGAASNLGVAAAARAAPDGYTVLIASVTTTINRALYRNPGYDIVKDFAPIGKLAVGPVALVVHPSVPATSVRELIKLAQARPGQLNYGSGGSGTVTHLSGEFFNLVAGIKTQHIPYKGGAQALTDVVGGQVHMYFSPPLISLGHIRSGRLRPIVLTGDKRLAALPELKTGSESGLKDFVINIWYGFLAPAATPGAIIGKWNAEVGRVLALPEIRDKLSSQGMDPFITTPGQFATLIKADHAKYARVIKSANIKLEQ